MRSISFFAVHLLKKVRYSRRAKVDRWYVSIRGGSFRGHVLQVFFGEDRLEIIT